MKKVVTFCFILSCLLSYSQKKETFNDRAELERITNAINLSGQKLNKSAQQQINGLIVAGLGSVISVVGGFIQNTEVITGGALISSISIPYFISSIINKKKAGEFMMDLKLENSSIKDDLICNCNSLMKQGKSSSECQEFFQTLNLGTKEGKERYKADLIRLGCE